MTNFEKVVDENVSEYMKGKSLEKLYDVLELYKWSVKFVKHLSEIRTKETCVNAVMNSIKKNSGEYWEEWVKPNFIDISK